MAWSRKPEDGCRSLTRNRRDFREQHRVNQDAGLDGRGGSSYINAVVLRNKDASTAWTSASDGTLEERIYLCQNWRGDVSALTYANGDQVEQVRYSPYGTPFGLPGGDTDSDGDCNYLNTVDTDQIQTWINGSAYDVRGDIELDGDVDATDKSSALAGYQGLALGRGKLSAFGNKVGWAGYSRAVVAEWYGARIRNVSSLLGVWEQRDPAGYVEGVSLYQYSSGTPLRRRDAFGTVSIEIKPDCDASITEPLELDCSAVYCAKGSTPEAAIAKALAKCAQANVTAGCTQTCFGDLVVPCTATVTYGSVQATGCSGFLVPTPDGAFGACGGCDKVMVKVTVTCGSCMGIEMK